PRSSARRQVVPSSRSLIRSLKARERQHVCLARVGVPRAHSIRASDGTGKQRTMPQLGVQLVIGKLLTDDEFRRRFERRPECLARLRERGIDLSDTEIAALVEADPGVWSTMAALIDQRLRKGRLPSNT